mgnify:CR=1 FL=1
MFLKKIFSLHQHSMNYLNMNASANLQNLGIGSRKAIMDPRLSNGKLTWDDQILQMDADGKLEISDIHFENLK